MTAENGGEGALARNPNDRRRNMLSAYGRRTTAQKLGLHIVGEGGTIRTMSAGATHVEASVVDAEWDKGEGLAKKWNEPGGVQALANQNPEAARGSMSGKSDTVTCMDGRTHKEGKVACAGCGLALLITNEVNLRKIDLSKGAEAAIAALPLPVQNFIKGLKASGIENTESHGGCGAGDMYAKFAKDHGFGEISGDEAARMWAEKLAQLLGGKYKGHAEVQPAFHNERAAYYSFSDSFNPKSAPGVFLPGYVISRGRFQGNGQQAAYEMSIAAGISLGKGGFGDRFTAENPFFFVIVARNADEKATGERELSPWLKNFNGRVKLQTVIIA